MMGEGPEPWSWGRIIVQGSIALFLYSVLGYVLYLIVAVFFKVLLE